MGAGAALVALKTALAGVDPSPQPDANGVYLWPDDQATISYSPPFIIAAYCIAPQLVGRPEFRPAAQGLGVHSWPAEINVCLADGPITTRLERQAAVEVLHEPWLLAVAKVLFANQGLGGTCLALGDGDRIFAYEVGNIGWGPNQIYWGIHFELTVHQYEDLPSI